jgi:hypothetical protein
VLHATAGLPSGRHHACSAAGLFWRRKRVVLTGRRLKC